MNQNHMAAEAAAKLTGGINSVLHQWVALRMAVENEWGGRDSLQQAQHLANRLFNFLSRTHDEVYIDDVEDILEQVMGSLNTQIADGSIEEVAEKLMLLREECLQLEEVVVQVDALAIN